MMREFTALSIASFLVLCGCSQSPKSPTSPITMATPPSSQMDQMPPVPATVADWARGAMLFGGLGNVGNFRQVSVARFNSGFQLCNLRVVYWLCLVCGCFHL